MRVCGSEKGNLRVQLAEKCRGWGAIIGVGARETPVLVYPQLCPVSGDIP